MPGERGTDVMHKPGWQYGSSLPRALAHLVGYRASYLVRSKRRLGRKEVVCFVLARLESFVVVSTGQRYEFHFTIYNKATTTTTKTTTTKPTKQDDTTAR